MYKKTEIYIEIKKFPVDNKLKYYFAKFMTKYPFSDKKIDIFLKFKTSKEKIGFIYRYLITACYEYGVPKSFINNYKNKVKRYNTTSRLNKLNLIPILKFDSILLFNAVNEMMIKKNTRQEKISNILEKISNKKINI